MLLLVTTQPSLNCNFFVIASIYLIHASPEIVFNHVSFRENKNNFFVYFFQVMEKHCSYAENNAVFRPALGFLVLLPQSIVSTSIQREVSSFFEDMAMRP